MKKKIIFGIVIICILLAVGFIFRSKIPFLSKASNSNKSENVKMVNEKDELDKKNQDYKSKIDKLKTDYQDKRKQAEDDRLKKRDVEIQYYETNRLNAYNTQVKKVTDEIALRDKENQTLLSGNYASWQGNAPSDAATQYTQDMHDEKSSYLSNTLSLQRIQRIYEDKIQAAKDTRDKNEADFKHQCNLKYDKLFNKLDSTYAGTVSDWEINLKKEQKELTEYFDKEDKKYNDTVVQIDKWRDDSFASLIK